MVKYTIMDKGSKWADRHAVVTGGASFIGSHLVDKLVHSGANVTVVDDLSSGKLENLEQSRNHIKFIKKDLEYVQKDEINQIFKDQEIIFHLAAVHGGRGFIQKYPADVCSNLSIDHHVFEAASRSKIDNIVFSSTACVYPSSLQTRNSAHKLRESDTDASKLDKFLSADIEYGWGKLMSEIQLNAFIKQYGLKASCVRFVTAYGPRENETHAIIALIYKALQRMDPYPIWGDGEQERDFTYVEDIVDGTVRASEFIFDGTPVNLGTGRRYKITEVTDAIFDIIGWRPEKIKFEKSMPVGPLSRALDNTRAKQLLGWEPKYSLHQGLNKTINWYVHTHKDIKSNNVKLLYERN